MYVFQLFDYYSGSRIILIVAFFECVAVAYIYGESMTEAHTDHDLDSLVQDCSKSSALAVELLQYCTKPSVWSQHSTLLL